MPQNCFFTTRKDDKGVTRMCPLCFNCGKNKQGLWFWEGEKLGYGKHKIVCGNCQHVIHEPKPEATKQSDS